MSKIASYLNEHLLGEVSGLKSVRRRYSQDGSVLTLMPELVVFPKVTNDIRKVMRFTWQLAEKGHVLGVTVRGNGTDTTGAAIGKGIIINTSVHLNSTLQIAVKERLLHVQAGANMQNVSESLNWQGLGLANYPKTGQYSTVGGALANNAFGEKGSIGEAVERLEVVLANGDVIETGRISKHEVRKKQGLQTLEGDIYRKLDGVIEDNGELIRTIAERGVDDHAGYASIAKVKDKDGSFDLSPLFIGSQGTLGIITEAVLRADFFNKDQSVLVAILRNRELSRETEEFLHKLEPSSLELIDGKLFGRAVEKGKRYHSLGDIDGLNDGMLLYVAFNDFSERAQLHKLKKVQKHFTKQSVAFVTSEDVDINELMSLRNVVSTVALNIGETESVPAIVDGAFIPASRREEFINSMIELASKVHVDLPIRVNMLSGLVSVYPTLKLGEVGDKQKIFRLMTEYSALVAKCEGVLVADDGEGRLKANVAWSQLDEATKNLYQEIRDIFDPLGTLNPGVKQPGDPRQLIASLRSNHDNTDFLDRGLVR